MINKRLIASVPGTKKIIAFSVAFQWIGMLANVAMVGAIALFLGKLALGAATLKSLAAPLLIGLAAILVRWFCTIQAGKMSFRASKFVKRSLREQIYQKLLRLGPAYTQQMSSAQIVQITTEGVEQLETYFGAYLPQFFYSLLAPVTLLVVLAPVSLKVAVALLVCVPLIPVAIAGVQTFAKKLLARYWGQYTALGDGFLENLQGLTTLKIYKSDAQKHKEMNREAEEFRRITMKVLTMQLNSISIMDLVAYGGAALGLVLAVLELQAGRISVAGCVAILLLSADFFLPMRQLGSFFHIAMNGMAASDKIFALLDLPEQTQTNSATAPQGCTLTCNDLSFSYDEKTPMLQNVSLTIRQGQFTAIVGESGCGKSTLAALATGRRRGYTGTILLGGVDIATLSADALLQNITYIGFASYLFKGTVAENLRMGNPLASTAAMWEVLEQAKLATFLRSQNGLDTPLTAQGANLSGGQRQRLALARALLHDSPLYIFDEASSSIDVESENYILNEIHALAKRRTVVMITHRLANVVNADQIYVLQQGQLAASGTHTELLGQKGLYRSLWKNQSQLEGFAKEAAQ